MKVEIVECLLQGGASIHTVDNSGLTPLMVAIHGAETMDTEASAEAIVR